MKRFFIGFDKKESYQLGWATCRTLIPFKYAFINTIMRESNARKCGKVFRVPFVFVHVRLALKMYSFTQKGRWQAYHLSQNETKYHANQDKIAKYTKNLPLIIVLTWRAFILRGYQSYAIGCKLMRMILWVCFRGVEE